MTKREIEAIEHAIIRGVKEGLASALDHLKRGSDKTMHSTLIAEVASKAATTGVRAALSVIKASDK